MRSGWLVFAVAVVGGCAQHAKVGATCGAIHCATDEVCDLTDPAGPTCISADGDIDGDGIPNNLDLCNHVPGGLYDEDGDGIGDECDPCPIAPPPDTPDPDGDAVDRPCDPDPYTPGDRIVAFSGFQTLPATWKATTPSAWQVEGGELVATPPVAANAEILTIPIAQPSAYISVQAAWRIDGTLANAPTIEAAVAAIDNRPAGTEQMSCGAVRETSDYLQLQTDSSSAIQNMPKLFDPAALYRGAADIEGATVGCALVADTSQGAVQTTITPGTLTEAHLIAAGAVVRWQYVLVTARVTP